MGKIMDTTSLSPAAQEALAYIRQHLTVTLNAKETSSTEVKVTVELLLGGDAIDSDSVWITVPHPD
jgi:hypothetical protein